MSMASFGSVVKQVTFNQPFGGGYTYFVMIDNYLQGQAVNTSEVWRVYLNRKSLLSVEDCEVICENLEENTREGNPKPTKKSDKKK